MFSDDLKYFISVSVRPGFGGLVSVSVRFGRNPKKSFRSITSFFLDSSLENQNKISPSVLSLLTRKDEQWPCHKEDKRDFTQLCCS